VAVVTAARPSKAIFNLVAERDSGSCAYCGRGVWGQRGFDFSLHHRRPAQAGGDRTVEAHAPGNLVLLHGHGANLCHGRIENERTRSVDLGFLVKRPFLPAGMPIKHAVHGWCLLADDGLVFTTNPTEEAA
jgi:hypothetical protein